MTRIYGHPSHLHWMGIMSSKRHDKKDSTFHLRPTPLLLAPLVHRCFVHAKTRSRELFGSRLHTVGASVVVVVALSKDEENNNNINF